MNNPTFKLISYILKLCIFLILNLKVKTTVYLATEYVEPLNDFMISQVDVNETTTKHSISWGIYNIIVSIFCIIEIRML